MPGAKRANSLMCIGAWANGIALILGVCVMEYAVSETPRDLETIETPAVTEDCGAANCARMQCRCRPAMIMFLHVPASFDAEVHPD